MKRKQGAGLIGKLILAGGLACAGTGCENVGTSDVVSAGLLAYSANAPNAGYARNAALAGQLTGEVGRREHERRVAKDGRDQINIYNNSPSNNYPERQDNFNRLSGNFVVACNYWADDGDGKMQPNELIGIKNVFSKEMEDIHIIVSVKGCRGLPLRMESKKINTDPATRVANFGIDRVIKKSKNFGRISDDDFAGILPYNNEDLSKVNLTFFAGNRIIGNTYFEIR